MKAKFIYENFDFKREQNPHKSLRIGKYRPERFKVKDSDGDDREIEVIDNTFMLNDMEVKLEFKEMDDGDKMADVYVDDEKSDMNVFHMTPFDYEFKEPEKTQSWDKPGYSSYGYPIAKNEEDLERLKEKYGFWYVSHMDYEKQNKNPFVAVAQMILYTY